MFVSLVQVGEQMASGGPAAVLSICRLPVSWESTVAMSVIVADSLAASAPDHVSVVPTMLAEPIVAVTFGSIAASSSMSVKSSVKLAGEFAVYGSGPGFVTVIAHVT